MPCTLTRPIQVVGVGMSETEGGRLYLVRLALGDGFRKPMSQRALAERIGYHDGTVSAIEKGDLRMSRDVAEAVAELDPEKRGPAWLLYGVRQEKGGTSEGTAPSNNHHESVTPPATHSHVDDRPLYETLARRTARREKEKKRGKRKRA